MKLGFASAILPEYSFEQLIAFAEKAKLECVELMCWPEETDDRNYTAAHIDADGLNIDRAEEMKAELAERGVEIASLGYYPNPLDGDLKRREDCIAHMKKCIRAARLLNVDIFNTFIGKNPLKPWKENMAEFRRVWPDLVKFAEDNGVRIGIENCPMYFTQDEWPTGKNLASSPSAWREIFSAIDSPCLGLNYDPSHLVWQRMDYIKPIYEFREKLFHIHLKDTRVYWEKYDDVGIFAAPLEYHAPKLPGLGDIQWGRVVSALTDVGYDGHAVIEVEDKAFEDSLERRLDAIRLSACFMRQYIVSPE